MKALAIKLSLFVFLYLFSCKTAQNSRNNFEGIFYKEGKDYKYMLNLRSNHRFSLNIKIQDANPSCNGNWEMVNKNTIILKCDTIKHISELLSNGYLNKREYNIKIISLDKIKFENIILQRK